MIKIILGTLAAVIGLYFLARFVAIRMWKE